MLPQPYTDLISTIKTLVQHTRHRIAQHVNSELIQTYWQIGKAIVEKEMNDNLDEKSSNVLLIELSKALTKELGSGFSRFNLFYMRLLYIYYKSCMTVSYNLTWSHIIELLKIEDDLERSFYEKQCVLEN
jgi:predicted nuclease of restriction endonuclease-like (RecB) superfamily